ncbi:hypothetical protein JL721_6797 [Aureococcus anophagefferens]|nr:hypothetical protein JL721_6797 [Aureococcus anophagefferens]
MDAAEDDTEMERLKLRRDVLLAAMDGRVLVGTTTHGRRRQTPRITRENEETRRAAAQEALDAVNDAVFSGQSEDEVERLLIIYMEAEAKTSKGRAQAANDAARFAQEAYDEAVERGEPQGTLDELLAKRDDAESKTPRARHRRSRQARRDAADEALGALNEAIGDDVDNAHTAKYAELTIAWMQAEEKTYEAGSRRRYTRLNDAAKDAARALDAAIAAGDVDVDELVDALREAVAATPAAQKRRRREEAYVAEVKAAAATARVPPEALLTDIDDGTDQTYQFAAAKADEGNLVYIGACEFLRQDIEPKAAAAKLELGDDYEYATVYVHNVTTVANCVEANSHGKLFRSHPASCAFSCVGAGGLCCVDVRVCVYVIWRPRRPEDAARDVPVAALGDDRPLSKAARADLAAATSPRPMPTRRREGDIDAALAKVGASGPTYFVKVRGPWCERCWNAGGRPDGPLNRRIRRLWPSPADARAEAERLIATKTAESYKNGAYERVSDSAGPERDERSRSRDRSPWRRSRFGERSPSRSPSPPPRSLVASPPPPRSPSPPRSESPSPPPPRSPSPPDSRRRRGRGPATAAMNAAGTDRRLRRVAQPPAGLPVLAGPLDGAAALAVAPRSRPRPAARAPSPPSPQPPRSRRRPAAAEAGGRPKRACTRR